MQSETDADTVRSWNSRQLPDFRSSEPARAPDLETVSRGRFQEALRDFRMKPKNEDSGSHQGTSPEIASQGAAPTSDENTTSSLVQHGNFADSLRQQSSLRGCHRGLWFALHTKHVEARPDDWAPRRVSRELLKALMLPKLKRRAG